MMSSLVNRSDGFSFGLIVTVRLICVEVITGSSAIRIIPNTIPQMEKNLLCATFLDAAIRFYEEPENRVAYEKWRMGKGGQADGQKDS